jgi:hypothetical protein
MVFLKKLTVMRTVRHEYATNCLYRLRKRRTKIATRGRGRESWPGTKFPLAIVVRSAWDLNDSSVDDCSAPDFC